MNMKAAEGEIGFILGSYLTCHCDLCIIFTAKATQHLFSLQLFCNIKFPCLKGAICHDILSCFFLGR